MKTYSYDELVKGFVRWVQNYRENPDGFDKFAVDDENQSTQTIANEYVEYLTNLIGE